MRTAILVLLVLSASPAMAQDRFSVETHTKIDHALIGSLMVLQGVDLSMTMFCAGARTCTEANPILRPLQDNPVGFGAVKMALATATSAYLLKQHAKHPKLVRWLTVASIGFYAAVIANNAREARQGAR